MSLAGQGAIALWQDIRAELHADFFEWHNRQHIPERVGIPGFLRGRRWIALEGSPEFFTLYETEGPHVHTGADYLARLNNPTDWTRRIVPNLENNVRSLCRVAFSTGPGQGGLIATLRYDVAAESAAAHLRLLVDRLLPELAQQPGIAGAHLCLADTLASSIETEEKRSRPRALLIPTWVILVEGGSERSLLATACGQTLRDDVLTAAGALGIERGLYQLQYSRNCAPATAG